MSDFYCEVNSCHVTGPSLSAFSLTSEKEMQGESEHFATVVPQ
ncbi:MAG: hypothetical protein WBX20_13940 [Terrimicrobiaceae bacterium]